MATVALLKVYFDSGRDHIGMFMPFVIDVIRALPDDAFTLDDVKEGLNARHGLEVPAASVGTLLNRAIRNKQVDREGGRYLRILAAIDVRDLISEKVVVEREHNAIAADFCAFAQKKGIKIESNESSLDILLSFLEQYHVDILVQSDPTQGLSISGALSHRNSAVVARYLLEVFQSIPAYSSYILRMIEGLVLRNTLLLKDIDLARHKFNKLAVYFDTGFLLQALGLEGEAARKAAREVLDILKATNARIAVFENTTGEIKRILSVYQRYLATPSGMMSLRSTALTKYLLSNHYTPGDIVSVIALLEHDLSELGLKILSMPARDRNYTLHEEALSQRLRRADETDLEPRVMHDVNCAASILTLRAGHCADSLEDARAVFATTSNLVVRDVSEWFRSEGGTGISPVVHLMCLSNIAWLKKPNLGMRLKEYELVALASAALRPSENVWAGFRRHLQKLHATGELSTDECVATVVRSLTDVNLIEMENEREVDAESVSDVIARVKESYARDAAKEFEVMRREAAKAVNAAQELAKEHHGVAKAEEEKRRQRELHVYARCEGAARYIANILLAVLW